MGKIKSITFVETGLDALPLRLLRGIRKQILNQGAAGGSFFDREKGFTRYPAIIKGTIPAAAAFALADNDIETIIFKVQRLGWSLNTITDNCDGFVF